MDNPYLDQIKSRLERDPDDQEANQAYMRLSGDQKQQIDDKLSSIVTRRTAKWLRTEGKKNPWKPALIGGLLGGGIGAAINPKAPIVPTLFMGGLGTLGYNLPDFFGD